MAAEPGSPSRHYRDALNLATSRAKEEGSPLVLEQHLLGALLEIRSEALDKALAALKTARPELLVALQEMRKGTQPEALSSSTLLAFTSRS